jgi:hypothetical protein
MSYTKADCRSLNPDVKKVIRPAGYFTTRFLGLRVRVLPGNGCMSLVSFVFCQVEVSATADHSSRGVLPSVVFMSVISKPQ